MCVYSMCELCVLLGHYKEALEVKSIYISVSISISMYIYIYIYSMYELCVLSGHYKEALEVKFDRSISRWQLKI